MATETDNLVEYLESDPMGKLLLDVPAVIPTAYRAAWQRGDGYPQEFRVDSYCIEIHREVDLALFELAKRHAGVKGRIRPNKNGGHYHSIISSDGVILTANRVAKLSDPRYAAFRRELSVAGCGLWFDDPGALIINSAIYVQVLHGWDERKKYSLNPEFVYLKYTHQATGRSLFIDLNKFGGGHAGTAGVTIEPIEPIVPVDNFSFRVIQSNDEAANA